MGPLLFYILGTILAGGGPGDALTTAEVVARAVAAGLVLALLLGALSLAAASLTERRAAAAVGIVMFTMLSSILVPLLVDLLELPGLIALLDVTEVASVAVDAAFGLSPAGGHGLAVTALAWMVWTGGLYALASWRLHTAVVSR